VFGLALLNSFPVKRALSKIRQKFGQRWQPPQQIQQLNDDQISALAITDRCILAV
jgi:hypothetical protein